MSTLESVLYQSRATLLPDAEVIGGALDDILSRARTRNANDQLSGVLVYADGSFFQLLEGPADALRQAMQRITADRRHKEVRILRHAPTHTRMFPDWPLAFVSAAHLRESVMGSGHGVSVDIGRLPADIFAPLLRAILTAPNIPNLSGLVRSA